MVPIASELGEGLEVLARRERGEGCVVSGEFLEFPQRTQAGEERCHLSPATRETGEILGEGGSICQDQRGVDLSLGDHFDNLVAFDFRVDVENASGWGFLGLGGDVGFGAFDDEVVRN